MPGRVRPALVTVQQARDVTASAQGLRKSDNRYVREHVYINPDLTKAQAAAAYQSMATGQGNSHQWWQHQTESVFDKEGLWFIGINLQSSIW